MRSLKDNRKSLMKENGNYFVVINGFKISLLCFTLII
jgi:hypothetical protein